MPADVVSATLLAMFLIINSMMRRSLLEIILGKLEIFTRELGEGNLTASADLNSRDEFGDMG
jgi:methyl-accepting chemotaxis protein